MTVAKMLLPLTIAALTACVTATNTGNSDASASVAGTLRVTNYTRDNVQVFLVRPNGDTYLRLVYAGHSESFPVPGSKPGDVVQLRATTPGVRDYKSSETITLADGGCAQSLDMQQKRSACEWRLP